MKPLQPRNASTNIHLPFFSPLSPKAHGTPNDKKPISRCSIKKQNTQASIQFQQSFQALSPTCNRKITQIGSPQIHKCPNSPTIKRELSYYKKNENDNIINSAVSFNLGSNNNNNIFITNLKNTTSNCINTPNIYGKKKITRSQSQNQKIAVKASLLPKIDRNIISIRFESNWENTSEICLYFISLVDKSNHQINPFSSFHLNDEDDNAKNIYVASIPEVPLEKLENLLNSSYLKDENNIFCENFDDQKLTIILSVHNSISIGGIRIFNPPTKNQSAAKNVSVYINAELCCQGEIPQNFGVNLKCNVDSNKLLQIQESQPSAEFSNDEISQNDYLIPRVLVHRDKYGLLPTIPIRELRITIVETYNGIIKLEKQQQNNAQKSNVHNYVGINGFDIFDLTGNPIYTSALINESKEKSKDGNYIYQSFTSDLENGCIKEVNIRGISELINCGMLLKKNKKTNKAEDMLLGEMDKTQYPTFIFTFTKPTSISKIQIWNYNVSGNNLQCGVRKLKLYTDNQLFWYGKIPCCDGKVTDMIKYVKSIQLYDPIPNIEQVKV